MAILYEKEAYAIIGCALEVHKRLGCGFVEKVYQDAFEIELQHNGIPYEREKHLTITYRDKVIDHDYFVDFVCYGNILVELKAKPEIIDAHKAQLINYLRASDKELGLLINFGEKSLKHQRLLNLNLYNKK